MISKFKSEGFAKRAETQLLRAASPLTGSPDLRAAAVLVPVIQRTEGLFVLLTLRAAHLSSHGGQIAFPGGKIEESDATPVETALRETEEEIGLERCHIKCIGHLPGFATGTGFHISPVIGMVTPGFSLTLNPAEVEEAFEIPLDFLMTPENHRREQIMWQGKAREFYVMIYNQYCIWGATALILRVLYERLFARCSE